MITSLTLAISTIITVSRTNWLIIWLAIELNLISFIPIINITINFQETEASVKYLLVQALGSSLLILRSISIWISYKITTLITIVLLFSLLIKIGIAPCHLWYPSVITSVAWIPALILSTWQKNCTFIYYIIHYNKNIIFINNNLSHIKRTNRWTHRIKSNSPTINTSLFIYHSHRMNTSTNLQKYAYSYNIIFRNLHGPSYTNLYYNI